jgi:hypothetical protein
MKTISLTLLSGLLVLQNPQETILNIKENSTAIRGKMLNSIYQQEKEQLEDLISILNLDVFEYYDLKNLYNTSSRREEYTGSEGYQTQYSKLMVLRDELVSKAFYLDFEPDYLAERSIGVRYDRDKRSISVSNDVSLSIFSDRPGYIQFDQLLFECPQGMTVTKRNVNYACVDVIEETISFELPDEVLALKILENKNHLRLMFVFNFTGSFSTLGKTVNLTSSDFSFTTDLRKVIIYNTSTNEIYSTYQ